MGSCVNTPTHASTTNSAEHARLLTAFWLLSNSSWSLHVNKVFFLGGANVLKPPASEGFSEGGIEKEIKRKSERAWRDFGSG